MPGKEHATSTALVKVDTGGHSIDVGHKDLKILGRIVPRVEHFGTGFVAISRTDGGHSIAVELSISELVKWRSSFSLLPYSPEPFLLKISIVRGSKEVITPCRRTPKFIMISELSFEVLPA